MKQKKSFIGSGPGPDNLNVYFLSQVRHRCQLVRGAAPRQEVRGLRLLLRQRHRHRHSGVAKSIFVDRNCKRTLKLKLVVLFMLVVGTTKAN